MATNMPNASLAGHIQLGNLTVNHIGLGTNRITDTEGAGKVLRRAVELGVNFIDTADIYQRGESEKMIGKTLAPFPHGLIVATKVGMSLTDQHTINDPDYIRQGVETSLTRLGTERIDLYQLHRVDPKVPIEETVGVLKQLQVSGKIRHIGLSEVTVEQIERARSVATIVSVQNQYNITERKYEAVLDYCEANGVAFIPWYPLAKGKLTGAPIEQIAAAHNTTPTQIALAWLLKRSPVMLPIPGTLSVEHLESNIAASAITLSKEEFDLLAKQ
jgi:aryl-alcohol dehydrogenase-like predicted oxidoreductase